MVRFDSSSLDFFVCIRAVAVVLLTLVRFLMTSD